MMQPLIWFGALLAAAPYTLAQSSRFERLRSADGGGSPVVLRVGNDGGRTVNNANLEARQAGPPQLLPQPSQRGLSAASRARPTVVDLPRPAVDFAPRQPVVAVGTPAPPLTTPRPQQQLLTVPPPPPPRIPPVVSRILGLDALGIPGLVGNAPPAFDASTFGQTAAQQFGLGSPPGAQSGVFGGQSGNPFGNAFGDAATSLLNPGGGGGLPNSGGGFGGGLGQVFGGGNGAGAFGPQAAPAGDSSSGLLGVLGSLTRRFTQASGIGRVLSSAGGDDGAQRAFGPINAGLPRFPGVPLLPGGIPKDANGQVDMLQLASVITNRVTNGTTLADVVRADDLQDFADNVTTTLLPETPDVDLDKFMGRWFEGINSPRSTIQRCVVHHFGGLTENDKTSTFTALRIYRQGSEFGQVRYSVGYAFREGPSNGMLQMHTSDDPDPTPFWVYKTGPISEDPFGNPQYEYAIVSNWVRYPVTVLVRDPDLFNEKYQEEVLRYLEDNRFVNDFIRAFNMLQPSDYSNCQYSDSTFQVFGK